MVRGWQWRVVGSLWKPIQISARFEGVRGRDRATAGQSLPSTRGPSLIRGCWGSELLDSESGGGVTVQISTAAILISIGVNILRRRNSLTPFRQMRPTVGG